MTIDRRRILIDGMLTRPGQIARGRLFVLYNSRHVRFLGRFVGAAHVDIDTFINAYFRRPSRLT